MGALELIKLFFGLVDPVTKITGKIIDLKAQQANQETERERIATQENITVLQSRRDVLIAESSQKLGWLNVLARFILMFPFAVIVWQYVLYDKIVCKWITPALQIASVCRTDGLSSELWNL